MSGGEVKGADVKVTGECSLVEEILKVLSKSCKVVYSSRVIYHENDDGCHKFLSITEVKQSE